MNKARTKIQLSPYQNHFRKLLVVCSSDNLPILSISVVNSTRSDLHLLDDNDNCYGAILRSIVRATAGDKAFYLNKSMVNYV